MHPIESEALDSPSEYVSNQSRQYVASNGTDIEHPFADRLVLLYFKGRKSGRIRRVPLVCVEDGDDLLIVGIQRRCRPPSGLVPEHRSRPRRLGSQ